MEAFGSLILDVERREVLVGVVVTPQAPRISHLLFVDDTLILCEGDWESAIVVGTFFVDIAWRRGRRLIWINLRLYLVAM